MKLAGALLAAGGSTRLGRPKAFLELEGVSFVRRLAGELAAVASPALVIAPPTAGPFAREIQGTGARLVVNHRPQRGIGFSLAVAVQAVEQFAPETEALLVALVDQPLADRALFTSLRAAAAGGSGWATSEYVGAIGPPALFPREAFEELAALDGDRGARALLERAGELVARVPFPGGALDVDTEADYERLVSGFGRPPGPVPGR
jgi:molybdenum cofactor cytidylyltransferase